MEKISNRHVRDKQMDMRRGPQQSTQKGVKFQVRRGMSQHFFLKKHYIIVFNTCIKVKGKSSSIETLTTIFKNSIFTTCALHF